MGSVNERRRYIIMSSLIGWSHTQNDPRSYNHNLEADHANKIYVAI